MLGSVVQLAARLTVFDCWTRGREFESHQGHIKFLKTEHVKFYPAIYFPDESQLSITGERKRTSYFLTYTLHSKFETIETRFGLYTYFQSYSMGTHFRALQVLSSRMIWKKYRSVQQRLLLESSRIKMGGGAN